MDSLNNRLISIINHECNTPLHGIINLSEMGIESDSEKAIELFKEINRSAKCLFKVVSETVQIIRLTNTHIPKPDYEEVNVYAVCSAVIQHYQLTFGDRIQFKLMPPKNQIFRWVSSDFELLITELIEHALAYISNDNKIDITLTSKTKDSLKVTITYKVILSAKLINYDISTIQ
ncbi:MAG: hypothetical protein ACXVNO_10070, partial [Bacteroidia bacterium]